MMPLSLFTFSSRKLRCTIILCIGLALVVFTGKVIEYLICEEQSSRKIVEIYNNNNYDVIFLGSSHVRQGIDPIIFDEKLGVNSYNLGTSSQNYDGSYTLLVEAAKNNHLKTVYLDMYHVMGELEDKKERKELTSTYLISDYVKPGINKYRFILQASDKKYWMYGIVPARRNWRTIFDGVKIQNNIEEHTESKYEKNTSKGFSINDEKNEVGKITTSQVVSSIPNNFLSEESKSDITKIINFCKKNDIELVLINIPITDYMLSLVGNYDDYYEGMSEFARENDLKYYDFNLCKREYFTAEETMFYDEHHLNYDGAQTFDELLSDLLMGKVSEEDVFWDSYTEKIKHDQFRILGYVDYQEGSNRYFEIVDNGRENVEYRVVIDSYDEEACFLSEKLLQEFSDNKNILIPQDEYNKLRISYRDKDTKEISDKIYEYKVEPSIINER